MIVSSTVREAFRRGARIAKPAWDVEEQIITVGDARRGANPPGNAWKLTNSEWRQMIDVVEAVSRFLSTACGTSPRQPLPTLEALAHFKPWAPGVEFWPAAQGHNAEPMSYETLAYWVRHADEYAFADGETIAEASSHSDAELWSDVILPAIERGEIEVTVWGEPL